MNSIATSGGAIALVMIGTFYPQESAAETFTGTQFLQWSQSGQDNYIGTAVTMATFVASRTNLDTSACLNGWYAASEAVAAERNDAIRGAISRNATYHPSAVILLVLEEACGSFTGS
ncbi:MAG: hypothetical protein AAFQ04_10525 [Pseudomonadota bacterium]